MLLSDCCNRAVFIDSENGKLTCAGCVRQCLSSKRITNCQAHPKEKCSCFPKTTPTPNSVPKEPSSMQMILVMKMEMAELYRKLHTENVVLTLRVEELEEKMSERK